MPVKKLLQDSVHPGAASYAKGTGAVLKIQSTVTGYEEHFIAFLTDFSQTFQSAWSAEEVYGRNDPIATFKGTKRTITLSFDIPAGSKEDAQNNLERTANLIQMMYPGYHEVTKVKKEDKKTKAKKAKKTPKDKKEIVGGTVLGRNPLVKISYGNLIKANTGGGLLGWIGSLNWKPNLEAGMFVDAGGAFYPKVIAISFDFNVLHQENLGQKAVKDNKGAVKDWLGSNKNFPFKRG